MKWIYLTFIYLLFSNFSFAQPCNFPFSASNTCAEAPLVCTLDGYCSSNAGTTNTGTPNAFCGVVENNSWVSFIAGSTTFELQITVDNCQFNNGLQAQFFSTSDCSFYTAVSNCLNPVFGTANLVCDNLTIGEVYYLMMDGKNGDVCDYEYQLISGEILSPADVFIDPVQTLCPNESLTINSQAVSPNSTLAFSWSTTNGNIISDTLSSTIEVDEPGIYEVVVADDQGCTAINSVEVVLSPDFFPTIAEPDTLDCLMNLTEQLSVFVDPPNGQVYTFDWTTTVGNIISGGDTNFPIVDLPGWYYVTITNDFDCEKIDSVQVFTDVNFPVADAGSDGELNCLVEMLDLQGEMSSMGNNFSYQWTTMDGNILSGANTVSPTINAEGTYEIVVTNAINGCTASDEVFIFLNDEEPTDADIQIKQPCFGETNGSILIESVIGGIPPYEYAFDGVNFGSGNEIFNVPEGTYTIAVKDATGCEWSTDILIEPQIKLVVDLGEDQNISLGCEAELRANINYPFDLLDTIVWMPEIDCDYPCIEYYYVPLENETYITEVIDVNGCMDRDTVSIFVQKDRHVYIPNAFTPNDDGVNDWFVVYAGKDVEEVISFSIFDRWGEVVYEQKNFLPNDNQYGWDGFLDKKRMNESVFVYYVEILFVDGLVGKYTGDLTLHR